MRQPDSRAAAESVIGRGVPVALKHGGEPLPMKGISIEALVQIAERLPHALRLDAEEAETITTSDVLRRFLQPTGVPAGWTFSMEDPDGGAEEHLAGGKHYKQCCYSSDGVVLMNQPEQRELVAEEHGKDEEGEPLYCKEPSCSLCRPWP